MGGGLFLCAYSIGAEILRPHVFGHMAGRRTSPKFGDFRRTCSRSFRSFGTTWNAYSGFWWHSGGAAAVRRTLVAFTPMEHNQAMTRLAELLKHSRPQRLTFAEWLRKIDAILASRLGMTHEDLPDCCYRDWYDDGISPSRAAGLAITNSMGS